MKKAMLVSLVLLANISTATAANYIKPEEVKQAIEAKKPLIIVDIQTANEFSRQHLPGSVETNAYPVKSDEEKHRLDSVLPLIKASADPVVIVCPRGKGGAKNSYDYLLSQGVPERRLLILEDGILGWPYKELMQRGR